MTKKKNKYHLMGGSIGKGVCGKKLDWKHDFGTVFVSQVNCSKCKATDLYKLKYKRRAARYKGPKVQVK